MFNLFSNLDVQFFEVLNQTKSSADSTSLYKKKCNKNL